MQRVWQSEREIARTACFVYIMLPTQARLCLYAGLPVVLKFLKFNRSPEIVLKSAIVLKFYSFG